MTQGESAPALPALMPMPVPALVPALVLDTNAVLDWLLFRDASMQAVQTAIKAGAVRWLASPRMRGELLRTLSYPALAKWLPNSEHTLATFDQLASICPEPEPTRNAHFVCSDPDDQVFIDLALAHQARWLITHDRALHKLSRRAALEGLSVLKPKDWPGP